ncbi:MAG: hypothetical protein K2V38_15595, partial [Gemmataceae bacterium]|nr:hypothetical protein [Gemmataceae bacterium]
AAITGGLGPAAYQVRLLSRALLQIDTRGPFAYDADKGLARFDVIPNADPKLPNDVQVTKVPANGKTSSLFSQILELEFDGGPTAGSQPPPVARAGASSGIKKLHAWTTTPGRYVVAASQEDASEAYGQDLTHDQAAARTTLVGAPLYVFQDRNALTAGTPQAPATLVTEPGPPRPVRKGQPALPPKKQLTVSGPGEIKLFDRETNAFTVTATWQTSLAQLSDRIGDREQDVFVFTDGARFADLKADYWLSGDVLKLWLEARAPTAPEKDKRTDADNALLGAAGSGPKPSQVQAVGRVRSHSAEYDVDDADQLTVHIADAKPAEPKKDLERPKAPGDAVAQAPLPPPQ